MKTNQTDILQVDLRNYLREECPYEGCEWNNDGRCESCDPEFLSDRIRDLKYVIEGAIDFEDAWFECTIPDDVCPYCGEFFETRKESRGEFWGAPAYEEMIVCPNNCM